jgi:hypothetical protein
MGETAPFVKHTYDSASDVEIAKVGLPAEIDKATSLASEALSVLNASGKSGDAASFAAARELLAQSVDALYAASDDLGRAFAWQPGAVVAKAIDKK